MTEVLILIATLAFMATFLLIYYPRKRISGRTPGITCLNNLKQVGLAFRLYAEDNRGRFPMNISTNDKPVVNEAIQVYEYFQLIENELGTPKVLLCPTEVNRARAKDFMNFSNFNVSYFIGLDANDSNPQSILSGDRNITNGLSPIDGILRLTSNVRFTKEMHNDQGNIALGDGSARQVTSARLRSEIIRNAPFATNRIKLP
jgi:hypothetical protein